MKLSQIVRNICLCLLIPFCSSLLAGQPSDNYVQAGYVDNDIEVAQGDGISLTLEQEIYSRFYALLRYQTGSLEINSVNTDSDHEHLTAGLGYRWYLQEQTSLYGVLAYEQINLDRPLEDENESGESLEAGVEHRISAPLRIGASAIYYDTNIDNSDLFDGDLGFRLNAVMDIIPSVAVHLRYEDVDKFSQWMLGLRWQWP